MKMSAQILLLFGVFLLIHCTPTFGEEEAIPTKTPELRNLDIERSSHHHTHLAPSPHQHEGSHFQGFWKKKFVWRPRWVKTWQEKKIYVAVWKRMWGPAELKEWVPVPKPPPGWVKHQVGNYYIKGH